MPTPKDLWSEFFILGATSLFRDQQTVSYRHMPLLNELLKHFRRLTLVTQSSECQTTERINNETIGSCLPEFIQKNSFISNKSLQVPRLSLPSSAR